MRALIKVFRNSCLSLDNNLSKKLLSSCNCAKIFNGLYNQCKCNEGDYKFVISTKKIIGLLINE